LVGVCYRSYFIFWQLLPKETVPVSRIADDEAEPSSVLVRALNFYLTTASQRPLQTISALADLQSTVGQLLQQAEAAATAARAHVMHSQ
jgi:hypothetical protein